MDSSDDEICARCLEKGHFAEICPKFCRNMKPLPCNPRSEGTGCICIEETRAVYGD